MANNLSDWRQMTLDEICSGNLQTGPFGSQLKAEQYCDEGIPVYMPKDLLSNRAVKASAAKITPEIAETLKKHRLIEGDILFSRRGDIARYALIDREASGGICGTGCLRARPDCTYDSLFLSYALQQDTVKDWLTDNAVGQTMLNLNTTILSALPLDIPPKAEQTKIAQILSTWDKAITTTERLLANSQQQKQALMQQLLTGQKRFAGFSSTWDTRKISEISTRIQRKSDGEEHPILTISSLSGFVTQEEKYSRYMAGESVNNYIQLNQGEFAYNKGNSKTYQYGCIFKLDTFATGLVPHVYVCFKLNQGFDAGYYAQLFAADYLKDQLAGLVNTGVRNNGLLNIKPSAFLETTVPVPPLAEQQKIAQVLSTADAEIANLQAQLAALKLEKKALMQQLLTGQRRVKPDADTAA